MYDVSPITSRKRSDCGSTCLQMLLAFYGVDVELDTLSEECNVNYMGCTAKDINVAGRKHGLDMRAWKMCGDELIRQDRPAIVWWRYNHFCVFCGVDDDGKVVICNPDKGRYRLSPGTFKSFYCEIALFNGEPEDLPEVEENDETGVTLTDEQAQEYTDLQEIAAKIEEVF